jgi:hypothetical protein
MPVKQRLTSSGVAFFFFILTLFFAPLAFGTTEFWSLICLEILVAMTGLFFFLPLPGNKPVLYKIPGLLQLLLLLLWMLLQCVPLRAALV